MSDRIYDINYKKLALWLWPAVLRKPALLGLLNALITPVIFIYNLFLINRRANLYRIMITPQVCYVEMALNDRYDSNERRIRIVKPKSYNPIFLFRKAETKPVFLYRKSEGGKPKTYLYQKGETGAFQYDFIVQVPVMVAFDINEMMAVIDGYILPDKIYKISIV